LSIKIQLKASVYGGQRIKRNGITDQRILKARTGSPNLTNK